MPCFARSSTGADAATASPLKEQRTFAPPHFAEVQNTPDEPYQSHTTPPPSTVDDVQLLVPPPPAVTREYDRFEDQTVTKTRELSLDGLLDFWAYAIRPGKLTSPPDFVYFLFTSTSTGWTYLHSHDVIFLADGKQIRASWTNHQGAVVRAGVVETVSAQVSFTDLALLAKASLVELRLGIDEFVLTGTHTEVLQELVDQFPKKAK